jgi:hypothetical protein
MATDERIGKFAVRDFRRRIPTSHISSIVARARPIQTNVSRNVTDSDLSVALQLIASPFSSTIRNRSVGDFEE